jgi:hypothetical protein
VYHEHEHRLTPRQPYTEVFELERNQFFTGERFPVLGTGQTVDITPFGMGIKTEIPLQPKETIRVYLPVQTVNFALPVFSEVRWVKAQNNYYQVGLQFLR